MSPTFYKALAFSGLAVLSVAANASAHAARAPKTDAVITARTAAEFHEQAAVVRKQMVNGRFATITVAERASVEQELEVIGRMLDKSGPFDDMNDRQKIAVVNAQESANSILTRNDDDRLVCEMRRPTGSNFKQKQCTTIGEARRLREQTRDGMDRYGSPGQPATDAGRP